MSSIEKILGNDDLLKILKVIIDDIDDIRKPYSLERISDDCVALDISGESKRILIKHADGKYWLGQEECELYLLQERIAFRLDGLTGNGIFRLRRDLKDIIDKDLDMSLYVHSNYHDPWGLSITIVSSGDTIRHDVVRFNDNRFYFQDNFCTLEKLKNSILQEIICLGD